MKILASVGALRAGSLNRRLLRVALEALEGKTEVDHLDLHEVAMPLYDGDIEERDGLPEGARRFKARIAGSDGLLIVSPEYNNSIPGTLKNAIDWASRGGDNPFKGKVALLMGASPGQFGAVRGSLALRQVLNALNVLVLPTAVLVARADQAFDEKGALKDARTRGQVDKAVAELLRVTAAMAGAAESGDRAR